jgi:hypothetical protein
MMLAIKRGKKRNQMSVTTTHAFLDEFPIKSNSQHLIIGTIHPHKVDNFEVDFFYGNKNSLWSILSDAFPHLDFTNKENIVNRLDESKTSITDMIRSCDRVNTSITQDKNLYNLRLNTTQIRESLSNSHISKIFFTSRFGKNSAAKLFVDHFNIDYRATWDQADSSFLIPREFFGRELKAYVLFSPSGQANTGIARSAAYLRKQHLYVHQKTPIKAFRIDFYKEKFDFLNSVSGG